MNILTYYETIGHEYQDKLLELWKKSWAARGFNPIVLTRDDVKMDPYFNEFTDGLHSVHQTIMEAPVRPYGLTCYYRWLAYARVINEVNLVCDYDVINFNFTIAEAKQLLHDNRDSLTFYHGPTPCIASGNKHHFHKFCKDIVEISNKNIDLLKSTIGPHYNDQEFITYNRSDLFHQPGYKMVTDHHENRIVYDYVHDMSILSKKTVHVSHSTVDRARRQVGSHDANINWARCVFITQALHTLQLFDKPVPEEPKKADKIIKQVDEQHRQVTASTEKIKTKSKRKTTKASS